MERYGELWIQPLQCGGCEDCRADTVFDYLVMLGDGPPLLDVRGMTAPDQLVMN